MTSRIDDIDWDFAGDSCASEFSSIHWHPCRFVSQIPASFIGLLTKPGDLVVDPYCGSGTSLVEAQRLGRRALGIDINPIAVLLSRSKLYRGRSQTVERALRLAINKVLNGIELDRRTTRDIIPSSVQLNKWYHPDTGQELAYLWNLVQSTSSELKSVFEAAFSSILLSVCNETRHWGYVCDNSAPKSQRRVDALKAYVYALEGYMHAYKERDLFLAKGLSHPLPEVTVVQSDAYEKILTLESDSVGLIITSPPYYGVCDYVKAQRLSNEWFGIEIEQYRLKETGARSKRHRNTARSEYLDDLEQVISESRRVLRRKASIALIVGESKARPGVIREIRELIADHGFDTIMEKLRRIPVQRRQTPMITQEYVIVGRKHS